jgi:hypothetical protein
MQASSGSRGARVYDASEIDEDFAFVSETIKNTTAAALLPSRLDTGIWVNTASVNIRDQIRKNDLIPLQFRYEAADCRLYYTSANVFNLTRLWHDVVAAAWGNPSVCVTGSTGYPSARNTSSTLSPPHVTAQIPLLILDPPKSVATAGNSTDGLLAIGNRPSPYAKSCESNRECGGWPCSETKLRCNSSVKNITACLHPCSNADLNCPADSSCYLGLDLAPSKGRQPTATENDKPKVGAQLYTPLRWGLCQPDVLTLKLKLKCLEKAAS